MKKKLTGFLILFLAINSIVFSQVDTTYIYNSNTKFGGLDIRIAKSASNYYYLQEDQTFGFRESAPGVRTNAFRDMTTWDSSPYKQGHLREKSVEADSFVMNYRLLVPDGYNPSFAQGYPLVLVLHGYGERGNCEEDICYHADRNYSPVANNPPAPTDPNHELLNNDHNLLHGGNKHLGAMKDAEGMLPNDPKLDPRAFPGFVLFPQNLNGWDVPATQDAIRIVRLLMKKYNIDEDRVYVEGISNGGHGMYEVLKRAPWLFAAGVGMSAVDDGFINAHGVADRIAHIPLWLFQGGQDKNPYPSKTMRYIQQFRSAGADIRYTLYPELGHGTWNRAFNEPDFFSWMLGHNQADIHSFENSKFICSAEGTRLELPPGFPAYQWRLNGELISGATSNVFYAKTPGTYTARFSRISNPAEAQWNQWSDPLALTVTAPPQANIQQLGTTLLRDLNGGNDALMASAEPHAHYYWYKNGVLLDLPGAEDDTLASVIINPTYGNGAYTLVVSDQGCKSQPSAPKHVIFSDQAPATIAAPTNFAGISTSPEENTLTWKDASSNEGGFEIWRRRKINGNTFSAWEFAGITGPNATSFDDTGVEPTVSYQYKIRAVSNTHRSPYVPAAANEGVVVQTVVDTEAPAAPLELTPKVTGVQRVQLTWKPSTDNTRIREYYVYYNNDSVSTASTDTVFILTGIPLNTNFDIRVKAMDLSRNLSAPSNTVKVSTYFSGLFYEHTTGSWPNLDSVDWSWAEVTGKVGNFSLDPKTQDDFYNFSFDGFLYVESAGTYQFRIGSSDGSRLYINNNVVANNDGIHDFKSVTSGNISLTKGPHRIYLEYIEYTELDSLLVEYKGPDTGNEWTEITRNVLKTDASVITAIGNPDNGPEDSFTVSVYPNPTSQDNINVLVETVLPQEVRVRLLDPVGRNLFEGIFQPEDITRGISMSPTGLLTTGMYVVMVEQGNIRVQEKVIIRR